MSEPTPTDMRQRLARMRMQRDDALDLLERVFRAMVKGHARPTRIHGLMNPPWNEVEQHLAKRGRVIPANQYLIAAPPDRDDQPVSPDRGSADAKRRDR